MSDPENFLTRWSRRKAEAVDEPIDPATVPPDPVAPSDQQQPAAAAPANPTQTAAAPPAIDLATLPSIESIVAGTDIKGFLQAGVPAELTRAALRRAWAADPAIRDFIGLSENSWDFTAPNGVPGFGPLSAEDASRLMAQFSAKDVVDKAKDVIQRIDALEARAKAVQASPPANEPAVEAKFALSDDQKIEISPRISSVPIPEIVPAELNSLQRNKDDVATQNNRAETDKDLRPLHRGHGGALPK